jgi:uncharacterized protein YbgA (DUF1722 family)/uncharacterized protein YbbK (DUF523 family)
MKEFPTPKILISKCLGFEKCRYDGSVINDPIIPQFQGHFEFITVCPEKEIGLGVPRDPIRIVKENDEKHLFQPATGKDITEDMNDFIQKFLDGLEEIDGFILKHRSPSCGLSSVKIYYGFNEKVNHFRGKGMFGEAITNSYSEFPVEDEGRLRNFMIRENFLTSVYTIAAFREIKKNPQMKELVDFHTRNKFLFMAYNQEKMRDLGKITANPNKKDVRTVFSDYEDQMLQLLKYEPKFTSWINVMQHAFGFISDKLNPQEKEFFLNSIEEYRDERIPLSVLIKLLNSWAIRFENEYLINQTFLNPFPKELIEITDSGKGRNR